MLIPIKDNKANVVMISAERFPSFGPISISSMLVNNGINVAVIQCIVGFNEDQIKKIIDLYVSDENQIIAVSTTFSRDHIAVAAIQNFLKKVRTKFPTIKVIVGGANNSLEWTDKFSNMTVMAGQNRETEILNWFLEHTFVNSKDMAFVPFSFKTSKIRWPQFFSENPPKGFSGFLEISRSCIFNCSFCSYQNRGMKLSYKDAKLVEQEFHEFYKIFKTPFLYMTCNTFNDDDEKIEQIAEIFSKLEFSPEIFAYTRLDLFSKQPKKVTDFYTKYVRFPFFGIESMNSKTLKNIKKGNNVQLLKDAIINFNKVVPDAFTTGSLIIGLPNDNYEDYLDAINFLKENVNFINISVLRLKHYEGQDRYAFSDIELNPKDFGYTTLPTGTRTYNFKLESADAQSSTITEKSLEYFDGWIRDDGYDYEHAISDAIKLETQLELPVPYGPHIFLRCRGISREKLIETVGTQTQNRAFIDYSYKARHPALDILEKETYDFYQELFQYYIKLEQYTKHEQQII